MTSLLDRIERSTALDAATKPAAAFWSRALAPSWLRSLLSGTPIAHPAHPVLVQLTAGSLLSASTLDALPDPRLQPASKVLIGVGLASALPSILAGWSDWLDTEQAEKRVGFVHAATNAVGLGAYALSLRAKRRGGSGRAAALVGGAVLGAGGWLGGHLAYAQGVGVDTTAFEAGPTDWTDVAATADVTLAYTQVRAGGVALLLTRVGGKPVAIADRCTHRGAPLSGGTRIRDCVICPWHGSEFDLTTGAVTRGPATRPQPTYEVRESGGRLEVRRVEVRALRTNPV